MHLIQTEIHKMNFLLRPNSLLRKIHQPLPPSAWRFGVALIIVAALFTSCTGLLPPNSSTPLPAEFLPTAAALTLAAAEVQDAPSSEQTSVVSADPPTASPGSPVTATVPSAPRLATATIAPATAQPAATELPLTDTPQATEAEPPPFPLTNPTTSPDSNPDQAIATPTVTAAPPIPDARIQIFRIGDLSKIVSPLDVSALLTCGEGKVVRVELFGEDGRLLGRHVRTYRDIP